LVLEVRASAESSDLTAVGPALDRLHDLGVRASLARVGALDTTVDALRVLPIEMAVLDGTLTQPLPETASAARTRIMLNALLGALRELDIAVIASDVDDERTVDRASQLGCTLAVGRTFGDWRPDPLRPIRDGPPGRPPDPAQVITI
jgi:EAL domain-containing protein (putative c-di-GMP-specific phosphodiesterase class I)